MEAKIIVLTPVKNEEWILREFLTITSLFADHIIIADQNSNDASKSIALEFEKVILINNDSQNYSEADRQVLMIDKARDLFGVGNFLLALDADELIRADSIFSESWNVIKNSKPGTVFRFDKPTPFFDKPFVLTYPKGFPLGYKDDGKTHEPKEIHSIRIPTPKYAEEIFLPDIAFLHLCFIRANVQFSKNRYYCILENLKRTKSLRLRRLMYAKYNQDDYKNDGKLISLDPKWYEYDPYLSINALKSKHNKFYYIDFESVKLLQQYGTSRFKFDPIWNFDWDECRRVAFEQGVKGIEAKKIKKPNKAWVFTIDCYFKVVSQLILIIRKLVNYFKDKLHLRQY